MSDGASLFTSVTGATGGISRISQTNVSFGANSTSATITSVFVGSASFSATAGELHSTNVGNAIWNGASSMYTFDCK